LFFIFDLVQPTNRNWKQKCFLKSFLKNETNTTKHSLCEKKSHRTSFFSTKRGVNRCSDVICLWEAISTRTEFAPNSCLSSLCWISKKNEQPPFSHFTRRQSAQMSFFNLLYTSKNSTEHDASIFYGTKNMVFTRASKGQRWRHNRKRNISHVLIETHHLTHVDRNAI
jgi:hypothetical protein